SKIVYPGGQERKFEYDGRTGQPTKVTELDGTVWTKTESTETGENEVWTSGDGKTWQGTIEISQDGTYSFVDEAGNKTIKTTDGKTTVIERKHIEAVAEALRKESGAEPIWDQNSTTRQVGDLLKSGAHSVLGSLGVDNDKLLDQAKAGVDSVWKRAYH